MPLKLPLKLNNHPTFRFPASPQQTKEASSQPRMEWPWQHDFPPFYTLQPNEDTRAKQLDAWSDLILTFCRLNRLFQLSSADLNTLDLFHNKKIDRRCSTDLADTVLNEMVKKRRAEWLWQSDKPKPGAQSLAQNRCVIRQSA